MNSERDPMLDMYISEMNQLLEQIEQNVIDSEQEGEFENSVNEIFRGMHTIKGNSSMMLFNNISILAHSIEDLFDYIRQDKPEDLDISTVTDKVLDGIDFIKNEVIKIDMEEEVDGDPTPLIEDIRNYIKQIKGEGIGIISQTIEKPVSDQYYIASSNKEKQEKIEIILDDKETKMYKAIVYFEDNCCMENIRAYTIIHKMKEFSQITVFTPGDIVENEDSALDIVENGFQITFETNKDESFLQEFFDSTAFLKDYSLKSINLECDSKIQKSEKNQAKDCSKEIKTSQKKASNNKSTINVPVEKLDILMDLIGELVISEAMVTRNPELEGLTLDSFHKSAVQLRRITGDIQDTVMSVRMVPLSLTFQKMNRIVRDMSRKIDKEVELEIIGAETEVDKNIIDSISDPLMHIIRNSLDHGIEKKGKITLEAKNSGGNVYIIVKDNGRGLNKEKIIEKAITKGLIDKNISDLEDKEIYSLILMPGFSTKESATEFSGRGVGMDVVVKNIEKVNGTIDVNSKQGEGTTMTIKIPLTLAIIDGMIMQVGESTFTVPTISIKESFRPKEDELIQDPDGNEMIMVRGKSLPIIRLEEMFEVSTDIKKISEGILVVIESDSESVCMLVDKLIGEQQVVVKPLPNYMKRVKTLTGCTLLSDGSISLIIDIRGLINKYTDKEVG